MLSKYTSILDLVVRKIHDYCIEQDETKYKKNAKKCT